MPISPRKQQDTATKFSVNSESLDPLTLHSLLNEKNYNWVSALVACCAPTDENGLSLGVFPPLFFGGKAFVFVNGTLQNQSPKLMKEENETVPVTLFD